MAVQNLSHYVPQGGRHFKTSSTQFQQHYPLWISTYAQSADGREELITGRQSDKETERFLTHWPDVHDGEQGCRIHDTHDCANIVCGSEARLLLFHDNELLKDCNVQNWIKTYLSSTSVTDSAISCYAEFRENPLTLAKPRHGDQTPLCFIWSLLLGKCCYEMKAIVVQIGFSLVIEFYSRCDGQTPLNTVPEIPDVRQELIKRMEECEGHTNNALNLKAIALEKLCHIIYDNNSNVLSQVGLLLAKIDENLVEERILSRDDRIAMVKWRTHLHKMYGWCTRCIHNAKVLQQNHEKKRRASTLERTVTAVGGLEELVEDFKELQYRIKGILEHTESTFSALICTIGLRQADEVSKLNKLAFFFLPLTVVIGIYGINFTAFHTDGVKWWWFVGTALPVLGIMYLGAMIFSLHRSQFNS